MRTLFFVALLFGLGFSQPISLTSEERSMLESHPLTCISTGLWAPFNTTVDGELAGIGIDYWRLITERLNIPYRCKEASEWGEVLKSIRNTKKDLTIATEMTQEGKEFASFSDPYVTYPYVVVTRKNVGFIYDINMLQSKRIVVGKGYSVASVLKKTYPNLPFDEVKSIDQALKEVADGKAYAVVDALPVVAYKLNENTFDSLKISGMLPERFSARIMLRKDYASLLPLINRAIANITDKERFEINKKWINVQTRSMILALYFYMLLGVALLLFTVLYLRARLLKKEIGQKEVDMKYLEELATIDSLTLVYNRHMLDTVLTQHMAISERYRQLLSVVFFDIDSFKAINDHYGHNVGDEVLVELTNLVSSLIRGSDIFGRWGGDEFLIILPESSQKQAKRLAETLHKKIIRHPFPDVKHVSCSFGVVAHQFGDTIKTLMSRADAVLYEVKNKKHSTTSKRIYPLT
jgi:polar amino acid transport system substrate-binding protein